MPKLCRLRSVLYRRGLALALTIASSACHDDRTLGEIVTVDLPGLCAGAPCDGWCERPPGACEAPSTRGICHPALTPEERSLQQRMCPTAGVRDISCGCNGETYGVDCQRVIAQVSLFQKGVCSHLACATTRDCAVGEFCDFADGSCQNEGTCQPGGPDAAALRCDSTPRQVCGCNGKTYRSQCELHRAGISRMLDGACVKQ